MLYAIVAGALRSSGHYVIGADNALPWSIPDDLKWFREMTLGKTLIMGRKTFEGLPVRPLPRRKTIVMTTRKEWSHDGVEVSHDPQALIEEYAGEKDAYVAGGSEIYRLFLPHCTTLFMTHIDEEIEGDTMFPMTKAQIEREFAMQAFTDGVASWRCYGRMTPV